jgi:hypothetical protein
MLLRIQGFGFSAWGVASYGQQEEDVSVDANHQP